MKIIAKTKYLEFKSTVSPDGSEWYYVKRTNDSNHDSAVVVTSLIKENDKYKFLLLKTARPAMYSEGKAEYCIESPAGLIGDINNKETVLECAKKELLEETGLNASEYYLELTNSSTSSGLTSETLSYVTAIILEPSLKAAPLDDGGIIVDRFYVDADSICNFIKDNYNNYSISSPTITGIYLALSRLGRFCLS